MKLDVQELSIFYRSDIMNPVKEINSSIPEIRKLNQDQKLKQVKPEIDPKSTTKTSQVDKLNISQSAQELNQKDFSSIYPDQINKLKTLSDPELQSVRNKVDADYYTENPQVLDKIADSILESPTFRDLTADTEGVPGISQDRINHIRNKINNGEYDADAVLEKVSTRILESTE